jgi:hypothetical protein
MPVAGGDVGRGVDDAEVFQLPVQPGDIVVAGEGLGCSVCQ